LVARNNAIFECVVLDKTLEGTKFRMRTFAIDGDGKGRVSDIEEMTLYIGNSSMICPISVGITNWRFG
jgi:hypothetical protein